MDLFLFLFNWNENEKRSNICCFERNTNKRILSKWIVVQKKCGRTYCIVVFSKKKKKLICIFKSSWFSVLNSKKHFSISNSKEKKRKEKSQMVIVLFVWCFFFEWQFDSLKKKLFWKNWLLLWIRFLQHFLILK